MMDYQKLSEAVYELIGELEEEDGEIGLIAMAVEVRSDSGSDKIVTYCNDLRQWVREAFMEEAVDAVTADTRSEDG